jgi:hypothetical protein
LSQDGFEFSKFIPKCIDPTYCLTDPPEPKYPTCSYKNPPLGTLRYMDGEVVTYTCNDPSELQNFSPIFWRKIFTKLQHWSRPRALPFIQMIFTNPNYHLCMNIYIYEVI